MRNRILVAAVAVLLVVLNTVGLLDLYPWVAWGGTRGSDWDVLSSVSAAAPYATEGFRWSPPAAWLLATLIAPLGLAVWRLAHLASLLLLRDWRVIVIVLASYPFWYDVADGNLLTFAFVAAWLALEGSAWAPGAFLLLTVLVPRPLMLPIAAWLLWTRPRWRLPFVGAALAVLAASATAGQLGPWVTRLLATPEAEFTAPWNLGPSQWIGAWWVPLGLLLACWLLRRGHLGLASLVASPYWIPYYLLFGLLDLRRSGDDQSVAEYRTYVQVPWRARLHHVHDQ